MDKEPARISLLLHFICNMLDKAEKYGKSETMDILGVRIINGDDERLKMFYLVSSEAFGGISLLQYIESENVRLLRQREELIDLAVKIAELNHGESSLEAMEEVITNFKSGLASGVGLRDMIKMIKERYPWSTTKMIVMTGLHLLTCLLGVGLYVCDIQTDVQFSLKMLSRSSQREHRAGDIEPGDYYWAGMFAVWHCLQPIIITLFVFMARRKSFPKFKENFLNIFEKPEDPRFFRIFEGKDLNCFLLYLPSLLLLFCKLLFSLLCLLKLLCCGLLALGSVIPIPALTLLYRFHLDIKHHRARSAADFRTNKAEMENIEKKIREHEAIGKLSSYWQNLTDQF